MKLEKIFLRIKQIGKKPATHEYKEKMVEEYSKKYTCDTFVETGTYKGEMLINVYDYFNYLCSVEIVENLYTEAKKNLAIYDKIHLYNGDSGKTIPSMIEDAKAVNENAHFMFWLDGHYSGGITGKGEKDTPIMDELKAIKSMNIGACVILIDDARCYVHSGEFIDYPSIKFLKSTVREMWPSATFCVKNDIIRVVVAE